MVNQVETDFLVEAGWKVVLDLEEEPLDVALSVNVVLQNQIVFTVSYTDHCCKIARLKP